MTNARGEIRYPIKVCCMFKKTCSDNLEGFLYNFVDLEAH